MSTAEPRSVLFVHVRKTGGTTLTRALGNRFGADACLSLYDRLPPTDRHLDRYRYVTGHVDVFFRERFRRAPYVITCLRDPIEQALSVYSYYRWFPPTEYEILRPQMGPSYEARIAAMRLSRECSLSDFIEREPELAVEHLGNVQTRAFCRSPREGGEEDLGEAQRQLGTCDFIALTERLAQSARLLTCRMGWRDLGVMPRANVTRNRLAHDRLPAGVVEKLRELTALDAQLYRSAVRQHDRQAPRSELDRGRLGEASSFPDAPVVSDLNFSDPIPGAGWWGHERVVKGRWFSWIGDTGTAWVDLRPPPGATRLVVEIEHVIEEAVLRRSTRFGSTES